MATNSTMRVARVVVAAVLGGVALQGCGRSADAPAASAAPSAATAPAATTATGAPGAAPATEAPASAEKRAEAIREASAQWPKVAGRWTRGDTDSKYVAWFDGDRLAYLEEDMNQGDYGRKQQRYWFDDGALFYYTGEGPSALPGGTAPGSLPPNVPVVAEFRGAQVVRAVSREHFGEQKLDPMLVEGIQRHAAALAGAAQDEWSAQRR